MKVVSLFSGAGGLDYGFQKAGWNIVYANDIEEDFCRTYENNVGDEIENKNVKDVKKENLPDSKAIIGGFPCLGFTIATGKKRDVEKEKNYLYKEFKKTVKAKKPDIFLMENVPGINKGEDFKKVFKKMLGEFRDEGYAVKHEKLNSANFGVPQKRKRIFILGAKSGTDLEGKVESFFENHISRTHAPERMKDLNGKVRKGWVTIREAIGDLPEPETGDIPNHYGTQHKVKLNGYQGNRPLEWDKPSPTITGRGSLSGGPVIHPHPDLERRLTVRECARLQSFPDDFEFEGSMTSNYAQIGNAVPPLLSFRIGQSLLRFAGGKPSDFDSSEWELPWTSKIPNL